MGRDGRIIGRKDKDVCEDGRNREEEKWHTKSKLNVKRGEIRQKGK